MNVRDFITSPPQSLLCVCKFICGQDGVSYDFSFVPFFGESYMNFSPVYNSVLFFKLMFC